jgi:hypothetical protein
MWDQVYDEVDWSEINDSTGHKDYGWKVTIAHADASTAGQYTFRTAQIFHGREISVAEGQEGFGGIRRASSEGKYTTTKMVLEFSDSHKEETIVAEATAKTRSNENNFFIF